MSPEEELHLLRRQLARLQREKAQVERMAEASEKLAERSRRAMLTSNEQLERHIEELSQAKSEAEQATLAKGRFLAVMSHELRTPLNGIVGCAELLMQAELDDEHGELARLLHRSGTALLTIVNDVLDYSRLEAGALTVERIPFDLRGLVQELVDLQEGVAEDKGIGLRADVHDELPTSLVGDPTRLRQVLLNLLHNAVKFTADGEVVVRAAPDPEPGFVRIAVVDTGIGIDPEVLPTLFMPFVQEDATTTRRFGGTGLGLAISRQLVELMGGTIRVESGRDRGSTFLIRCPLETADREADADDGAGRAMPGTGGGPTLHVLVVDDHDANRFLLRKMLDRLGCRVSEAADGEQAVRMNAASRFDVVLMDISMPVMNGYDATVAIRSLGGHADDVPILALTANALPEDRDRCFGVGMDGYLSKPIRLQQLADELAGLRGADGRPIRKRRPSAME